MCGRFAIGPNAEVLATAFPGVEFPADLFARFNVAPSQEIAVIASDAPDRVQFLRWGLIPSWAKDPAIGNRTINARAETIAEKPSFRDAFRKRRCLVIANGFYEWRREPKGRSTPFLFRFRNGAPFAMAGLWETWRGRLHDADHDAPPLRTCTLVTTTANALVAPIHERMPVILPPEARERWLDLGTPSSELHSLLVPHPPDAMEALAVSSEINDPKNEARPAD